MLSRNSLYRTLTVFIVGWMLAGVAISCNTMEGAGKDMERAGENIQDAADDAKN